MSTLQPQPSSYIKLIPQVKQQFILEQIDTEAKDFCITRQASKKQFVINVLDSQKTQRIKNCPNQNLLQGFPINQNKLQPVLLMELSNEIDLQREAIERANQIIIYLKEQNERLVSQLQRAGQQLQNTHQYYKQQLNSVKSTMTKWDDEEHRSINQNIISNKICKTTPVKIYGRQDQTVSYSAKWSVDFQELHRIVIKQSIININNEMSKLEQLAQNQSNQLKHIIEQQKYLQAFVEDEVLSINMPDYQSLKLTNISKIDKYLDIQLLLKNYQEQILNWQSYANTLRKQLLDCIAFIEEFISIKDIKSANKLDFTSEDLLKFITKQICKIYIHSNNKKLKEIKQLRDILEQLFTKLKKKEIYFKNPIEKYIS